MVALETPNWCRSNNALELTGSLVKMKSSMIDLSTAVFLSEITSTPSYQYQGIETAGTLTPRVPILL
jgi:hypothetical protein